ncbi:unnamed protein product [Brassica rapa subsp. trilocularis]
MSEFSSERAASAISNYLQQFSSGSSLQFVPGTCNKAASEIAISVTRDYRHQSYVARSGHAWLCSLLAREATN